MDDAYMQKRAFERMLMSGGEFDGAFDVAFRKPPKHVSSGSGKCEWSQ